MNSFLKVTVNALFYAVMFGGAASLLFPHKTLALWTQLAGKSTYALEKSISLTLVLGVLLVAATFKVAGIKRGLVRVGEFLALCALMFIGYSWGNYYMMGGSLAYSGLFLLYTLTPKKVREIIQNQPPEPERQES